MQYLHAFVFQMTEVLENLNQVFVECKNSFKEKKIAVFFCLSNRKKNYLRLF